VARTFVAIGTALLQALSLACGGYPAPVTASRIVRMGYSGEADFGDLPSLLAQRRLRADGYRIDVTYFSGPDVAVAALAQGTVDFTHGSIFGAWSAISRGAPIRTVMEHVANPYRFVATTGVSTCRDSKLRRLGLPGAGAVSTQLVRTYMQEECPAARPEELWIMESSNRAAAFLGGTVDAGSLELSVWLWLRGRAPGRFTVLSDFSTRWPSIKTTGVHVNAGFAARHPDVVREYVRALVTADRDAMADPALIEAVARENLQSSDEWLSVARAYVAEHVWPLDGGLARADVEATLDFFKAHSQLDSQLTADAIVDLTFLNQVLAHPAK
jgi:ABC-type nitrate/sulfonate/bicarbonate transport system substrate-binding protein